MQGALLQPQELYLQRATLHAKPLVHGFPASIYFLGYWGFLCFLSC